ncbi:FmdB family zinc ribbon protein [Natronobiforma cellulositropha]|uniref:hypothetical protein n=1 Tax=Natronobiforma cellulositropha TaxID=1679076 RepID=UPI0021D60C92|nr:hypothetical protein [Natronobiforma cellulositropha]
MTLSARVQRLFGDRSGEELYECRACGQRFERDRQQCTTCGSYLIERTTYDDLLEST